MKKLIYTLVPPPNWRPVVAVLSGIFFGLGVFVFYICKAPSYLSDNPETCINCHVMNPQFNDWAHSSHRNVATCNDCHVPHNNFFSKYLFKAKDGLRHATIFTMRNEPQVIYILEAGKEVVQSNCIRCHERVVGTEYLCSVLPGYYNHLKERQCLNCHRETPHSRVNGRSSTPNALVNTNIESRTEIDKDDEEKGISNNEYRTELMNNRIARFEFNATKQP
jgi:cytochrome c nitrite reductase small subunit